MDKQPILSLCIPTNGAVKWILPVIESIYAQGYDNEKFEVVITDNGEDSHLPEYINIKNYKNLRYIQTTDKGFLNLVTCLREGKGLFCKMINHRSKLLPGSISEMVELVELYKDTMPIIYMADNRINSVDDYLECINTDDFVRHLSYWCSWSAGIGFWQKDISKIASVNLDLMFPNFSLLFGVREESHYIIWNKKYQKMEDDTGKGGYDLFKTFGVILLDLLNELRINSRISSRTFVLVKLDLYDFLCKNYIDEVLQPTKHTFIIKDIAESLEVYYGRYYYWKMVLTGSLKALIIYPRRLIASLKEYVCV